MGFVNFSRNTFGGVARGTAIFGLVLALSACQDGTKFNLFKKKETAGETVEPSAAAGKTEERDVEAPDVFQVTEAGLWDGRPSLGGVWVAHPEVKEPERVIIRNEANGKFVVGALFRRERETPGPRLQVSSDAAETLGMLAGQPMKLNVTALRREEVELEPAQADVAEAGTLDAAPAIDATPLDPIAGASAAIEAAENAAGADAAPVAQKAAAAAPAAAPKPKSSKLDKPYIQIGIFSVEKNANNTATAMRQVGMIPTVKKQSIKGKPFWRVLVGPANNSAERAELLKKIKASGFTDAYAVTN